MAFRFRYLLLIGIIILFHLNTLAQNDKPKWSINPFVGLQQTKFNWSIAGNVAGTDVNVLSELIWRNVKGPNFGLAIKYNLTDKISLKTTNQYHQITKGYAEDTDYADNDRQNSFYYDLLKANKGNILSSNLQICYQLFKLNKFNINPVAGVSYQQTKFYLLESPNNPLSENLKSSYTTKYRGFDGGVELVYNHQYFSLTGEVTGGLYRYSAKANWNLIPNFEKPVSFIQKSNSFAIHTNANLSIPISNSLAVTVIYKTTYIKTYEGVDRTYAINQKAVETVFNGANFNTNSISIAAQLRF